MFVFYKNKKLKGSFTSIGLFMSVYFSLNKCQVDLLNLGIIRQEQHPEQPDTEQ